MKRTQSFTRNPEQRMNELVEKAASKKRPPFNKGRREVARYPYLDENGHQVFYKIRYQLDPRVWDGRTKDFRCFTPSPINPNLVTPGAPEGASYLYRLPELLADAATQPVPDVLHWAEGEKDADALIERGCWATSTHTGALRCSVDQALWAVRALNLALKTAAIRPLVLIWVDKDWPSVTRDPNSDPRVGAYGAYLRFRALREAGWRGWVEFVRARGGRNKDAYDHLKAGYLPAVCGEQGVVLVDRDRVVEIGRAYEAERADRETRWANGYEVQQ